MADHTEPRSVASQVPFADICVLLEKIAKTQGTDKKKKVLRTFVESWREAHKSLHGGGGDVSTFTPVFIVDFGGQLQNNWNLQPLLFECLVRQKNMSM